MAKTKTILVRPGTRALKFGVFSIFFVLTLTGLKAQKTAISPYTMEEEKIYRSPIRAFLNKFSLTTTMGYGYGGFSHNLDGFFFYQNDSTQFIFENGAEPGDFVTGFTNWINDPMAGDTTNNSNMFQVPFVPIGNPVNNPALQSEVLLVDGDTTAIGFRATTHTIPLNAYIHFNVQKFRIGIGGALDIQMISQFKPTGGLKGQARLLELDLKKATYRKLYITFGYKVYDYWDISIVPEIQIGRVKFPKTFNQEAVNPSLSMNLGVSLEKNVSEYFRFILRPAFDFRNYQLTLPEVGTNVSHKQTTFFLNFGVSITFPEIPRSPIKSDKVQLKHLVYHPTTGRRMEVRGQPIWKKQNPKVGENHRVPIRFKRKNRNKINPY